MKRPKELSDWDFTDTVLVPDGWDQKTVPDNTRRNFQILIDEHNNLVECFNAVIQRQGFDESMNFEGEE